MTDREKFRLMCTYYLSLTAGDTYMVDDAFKFMKEEGIVDEDGEEIYEEEEEGCDGLAMPFYKKEVKE
jgi:hypothetical protein